MFHAWRCGICDLETGREKTLVLWRARGQFMGCTPGCKSYHSLPSVSATVLPRRDPPARLARLVTGDNDSSIASRLSNIISPYSSYGSSNVQYISPDPSSSSLTSVITESSCEGTTNQQNESMRTKLRSTLTRSSRASKLYNEPSFFQIPGIRICSAVEGAYPWLLR